MSITTDDIKKLASLSRIRLSDEEMSTFAKEIDGILGYVEQIKNVSEASAKDVSGVAHKSPASIPHRNMMREDVDDKAIGNAKALVDSAPQSEDGYIKVKKILG